MLMGIAASPAWAQTAQSGPPGAGTADTGNASNEIVVTGSRRTTTLQDAPINISAVSAETLAKERIDDVKSLAAFTPGLTVADTGPGSTGQIILRGISTSDTSTFGANLNSAVGVYLGEVPLYLDLKLIDVARVEVLQGPQGTLYGLGTLSGAVRYIPNRPDVDRFSVDLHARGYFESHSTDLGGVGDIAVNIPIWRDHIAFRTVTGYYDNAGFIDYNYLLKQPGVSNPQPVRGTTAAQAGLGNNAQYGANFTRQKDVNFEHTFTTRNQLLLEANPNIKAYLTYAHQTTDTNGRQANGNGVLGTGKYEFPSRYLEPSHRVSDLYAAEVNVNLFNIAQMVSSTAFTKQTVRRMSDNTDLLLDLDYGYEAFPNFSSYNQSNTTYNQFDQEVRLISSHGGPFSWVLGGFYNNFRSANNYREYVPGYAAYFGIPRPDDLEYISFVNTQTKEKAVYGEGTLHITKAWQVTGGVRYFKYDAFVIGGTDTPLTGGGIRRTPYPLIQFAPSRIKSGSTGSDGTVFKANTSYKFSDSLLGYFTYSTGYRTGNVNRVAPCVLPLPPGQNVCALPSELQYTPDKTRNMELGVRASLFNRRLQFTVDGFKIDWSDIQVPSQTVNGAVGIIKNGGKALSQGFEFSGSFKVTPNFLLQGTYAYTDAHLTQDVPALVVSQGITFPAFAGDRLPGSTKNSASVQGTYSYPLGGGNSVEAIWATTYTGDIYSRVGLRGNGERIPGFVTHRSSLSFVAPKYDISLFADNIFDKYAVTAISEDISSFNQTRTGVVERYYSRGVLTPRRVGVELRYHY
nr:TonB-dependent receptor [Sphingomonas bacterium]